MSMFTYKLPGGLNTATYLAPDGQIKFDPPVYEQRYTTAVRIIEDPMWKQSLRKIVDFGCAEIRLLQLIRRIPFVEHILEIVDFGCAEMRLLQLIRRIPFVEHILEVDIDSKLLEVHQQRAIPLISDHLRKREKPLRVEILEGSMTDAVEQLYDVDVVIAIEVIEHLHADVLEKVPENVFGFIQPKLAIFTTPNCEFNILFNGLLENGFRHFDHKFEWTRDEFKKWALNICKQYPNYSVAFDGVGKAPDSKESLDLGCATQIAIFARNDVINRPLKHDIVKYPPVNPDSHYRTVYAVDFPYKKDERSKEQKMLDETRYYINQSRYVPRYFNRERSIYQLPWRNILKLPLCVGSTEKELLDILQANDITVEGDFIILPEYDVPSDDDEDIDYDTFTDVECQTHKSDEELSQLASGCINLGTSTANYDWEEDWD